MDCFSSRISNNLHYDSNENGKSRDMSGVDVQQSSPSVMETTIRNETEECAVPYAFCGAASMYLQRHSRIAL